MQKAIVKPMVDSLPKNADVDELRISSQLYACMFLKSFIEALEKETKRKAGKEHVWIHYRRVYRIR